MLSDVLDPVVMTVLVSLAFTLLSSFVVGFYLSFRQERRLLRQQRAELSLYQSTVLDVERQWEVSVARQSQLENRLRNVEAEARQPMTVAERGQRTAQVFGGTQYCVGGKEPEHLGHPGPTGGYLERSDDRTRWYYCSPYLAERRNCGRFLLPFFQFFEVVTDAVESQALPDILHRQRREL